MLYPRNLHSVTDANILQKQTNLEKEIRFYGYQRHWIKVVKDTNFQL